MNWPAAIETSRDIADRPVCIVVETDREQRVGGYGSLVGCSGGGGLDQRGCAACPRRVRAGAKLQRYYL